MTFSKRLGIVLLLGLISFLPWSWILQVDIGQSKVVTSLVKLLVFTINGLLTFLFIKYSWQLFIKPRLTKPSIANLSIMIISWAFLEFLLSWVISVVWIGKGSSIDTTIPFISLTPTIMPTPIRYASRLLGYHGLSSFIGILLLISFSGKKWCKHALILGSLIIVLSFTGWFVYRIPNGTAHTMTIVADELHEPAEVTINKSVFIILPEYGLDTPLEKRLTVPAVDVTGGDVYYSGSKHDGTELNDQNTLVYGSVKHGDMKKYTKSRLVAGGEFLPYFLDYLIVKYQPEVHKQFVAQRSVAKGQQQSAPFPTTYGIILGNASCSSVTNPIDYRRLTKQGANVLANSASMETFNGSRLFGFFHNSLARFNATANARPFIQSAISWKAFALDHNGRMLAQTNSVGTQEVLVTTNSTTTVYSRFGEWLTILGAIFLAINGASSLRKYINKHNLH